MADSESTTVEHPVLAGLARFVLRWRYVFLVTTLSITASLVAFGAGRIRLDTTLEAFLATDSDRFKLLEMMRDDFGRDDMFVVMVEGDVFTMPFLARLRALHEDLAALDVPVTSLGERVRDRYRRGGDEPDDESPSVADKPAALMGLDGDFGSFGEDDEGWGGEAGGTVVDEIISLINVRRTTFEGGALHTRGLLDEPPTQADLPALRAYVLGEPSLVGRVVDTRGKHAALVIRTHFMSEDDSALVYDEVLRVTKRYAAPDFSIKIAGLPVLGAELNDLMLGAMRRMGVIATLLCLTMMALIFRHPLGVLGPVLVVVQSVVWTFGLMALAGAPITMITTILPAFIICVGVGDAVHVQSVYRQARRDGVPNEEAIVRAIANTGLPVVFTSITTAAGLMSFRFTGVDAIRDLGNFGALGVMVALALSLVFIPVVLSFNRHSLLGIRTRAGEGDRIDRALIRLEELSQPRDGVRRHRRVLLVIGALAVLAGFGAAQLRVYHNPLTWIPDGYKVKQAFTAVDEYLGGTADVSLIIDAKPGHTIEDRQLMLALDNLERELRAYQHPRFGRIVGNAVSVLDVVRESNRALHEGDQAAYAIPATQRGVVDTMTLFESAAPDDLRRLATLDLTRTLMVLRVKWMDASSYRPFIEHVEARAAHYVGDLATVRVSGSAVNLLTVVDGLLQDLLRSFGAAFVVISVMMVLLLREVRFGLLAMLPNLLPILLVMGFMGWVGIPIDLNNILIGSIAIGIAVDDTIHLMHHYRSSRGHGQGTEGAINYAFKHCGRAMVLTTVILVFGFMVFITAEMANLQRFGMLIALTLVFALAADLIFAPALLRAVHPEVRGTEKGGSHEPSMAG